MRRAANVEPQPTLRDLARAAYASEHVWRFNPFLSDSAVQTLHLRILRWLELCVAEEELERMLPLATSENAQKLERELQQAERVSCVRKHPRWLVFEVEQRLQIRQDQQARRYPRATASYTSTRATVAAQK